ncbi:MAG: TIGR04149 family rSAM-modified RiPP [Candidatus Odinarchaeota archaeon]
MKKKLKLRKNPSALKNMSEEQMNKIAGGCTCGCCYSGSGGSSTIDNACANADHGYVSYPC